MLRRLGYLIRRDERRSVVLSFLFLVGLVGSHTALESARDGLFLANIPGAHLPIVYIAIALVSFLAQRAQASLRIASRRRELSLTTAFAGVGTLAFGAWIAEGERLSLYALYVWSGVVTALSLLSFWSLLGTVFSATQAKRVYGVIGIGSMVGAVLGSGGASLVAELLGPRVIVLVAGCGFLLSALLPRGLPGRAAPAEPPVAPILLRARANMAFSTRGPYVWRLVGIVLFASITVTLTDFAFKSTMVRWVAPEHLTQAFARTYAVLNILSLAVQLVAAGVLLRRLTPSTLIAVLPVALALGGGFLALTGGLLAAVLAKGADGAFRHGLYRTGVELLCIPLSAEGRRKAKATIEVVGQRGGQVVASLLLLSLAAVDVAATIIAAVMSFSALVWLVLALRMHRYYIEQFRSGVLRESDGEPSKLTALDAASLETLIATLDSDSDAEVIAALSILERERKLHLVPGLILFHPSEEVVVAALRVFLRGRRKLSRHALDHLLEHRSPKVRAEAYSVRAVLFDDPDVLVRAVERETAPEVRAAIVCALVANGSLPAEEGRAELALHLAASSATGKLVVLEMLAARRIPELDQVVVELSTDSDVSVKSAAIEALSVMGTREAAAAVVDLLRQEALESSARRALVRMQPHALPCLVAALRDRSRPAPLRWAIPRALGAVDPQAGGDALVDNLGAEPDGMVRYRSIVALGALIERDPRVRFSREKLERELRVNVSRAYRYMDRRVVLTLGAQSDPSRKTVGHDLLVELLTHKEQSTVGRIFRLLAVLFPQHQFGAIYRAIESGERLHRASAVELTSNLLRSPLREAVVGLVEDMDDDARFQFSDAFHERITRDYDQLLRSLLRSKSAIVRDVAAFHVGELGDPSFLPMLNELVATGSADVARALGMLQGAVSIRDVSLTSPRQKVDNVG